jgi:ComF family protein
MLSLITNMLGEIIAPSRCSACDEPVAPRVAFCAACAPSVTVDRATRGLDVAAFEYGGALARAITRFKYGGDITLGPILGGLACAGIPRLSSSIDVVTHVPLHPRRLVSRGFDQSALLAASIAKSLRVPFFPGLIRRTRDTRHQASLGRAERMTNVVNAFAVDGAPTQRSHEARLPTRFLGTSVLLIDDVRTTGATLDACRAVLVAAGAAHVSTLVLARDV